MPTKFSRQFRGRQYDASNAVASTRIDGIVPAKQLEQNLSEYVAGKMSIAQLVEETKQCCAANRPK
jgi:hypothetical protein